METNLTKPLDDDIIIVALWKGESSLLRDGVYVKNAQKPNRSFIIMYKSDEKCISMNIFS